MSNDIAKDAAEPCPFCGTIDKFGPNMGVGLCAMKCQKCGARGPISPNYKEATAAWNTRATAADKERIAALTARVEVEVKRGKHWCSGFIEKRKQLWSVTAQLAEKTQECEGLRGIMEHWREFLKEVEVAEDRSNLDGDDAETVLLQLNESAEAMLALEARKEGE